MADNTELVRQAFGAFTVSVAKPAGGIAVTWIAEGKAGDDLPRDEHAVPVCTGSSSVSLDELQLPESQLEQAIPESDAGEFDAHDIAVDGSNAILHICGPDAGTLLACVAPVLKRYPLTEEGTSKLRCGEATDRNAKDGIVDIERFQLQ